MFSVRPVSRTEQAKGIMTITDRSDDCTPSQCFIFVDPHKNNGEVYKVWVNEKLRNELLINDRWEMELKHGKEDGFDIVRMIPVSVTKYPKN
jgi:hypothetical protein